MAVSTIISKTDLGRRTRRVVDQARRGRPVIIEGYGEEQALSSTRPTIAACAPSRPTMPCPHTLHPIRHTSHERAACS
jgi:hypothetical protein